jgi:cobalt/nickel transport system permease protein
MHIPDGFVDGTVALVTGAASLAAVTAAVRRESAHLGERSVPLLGVTAAFVFAAQMVNFPVVGGTSGHLLGGVLTGVLMGPWAAAIVLTVVLSVQALAMADGGITALGANVLNMAVIGGMGGYLVFAALRRLAPRTRSGYFMAVAGAAWASVVLSSAAASLELALSGTVPLRVSLPAMTSIHMVIGVGEALITVTIVAAVLASRPDLVKTLTPDRTTTGERRRMPAGRRRVGVFTAGALALAVAVFLAPLASSSPDGLERVAQDKGFAQAAGEAVWRFSPLPDYSFPGLGESGLATAAAGLAGTLVLFGAALAAGKLVGRSRPSPPVTGRTGASPHVASPPPGDGPPPPPQ